MNNVLQTIPLTSPQFELVSEIKEFLTKNYVLRKHHAASIITCGQKKYYSLHLDTKGFDVCAEPGCINQAILAQEKDFDTIVTAEYYKDQTHIVNPCGNCRQILLTFCPQINVIVSHDNELSVVKAIDLLPLPYT